MWNWRKNAHRLAGVTRPTLGSIRAWPSKQALSIIVRFECDNAYIIFTVTLNRSRARNWSQFHKPFQTNKESWGQTLWNLLQWGVPIDYLAFEHAKRPDDRTDNCMVGKTSNFHLRIWLNFCRIFLGRLQAPDVKVNKSQYLTSGVKTDGRNSIYSMFIRSAMFS